MKKVIIILINLFIVGACPAQQSFFYSYGDSVNAAEWAVGITMTIDSGFFVMGTYASMPWNYGYVANLKVDKSGNEIFRKSDSLLGRSFEPGSSHSLIRSFSNYFYTGGFANTNFTTLPCDAYLVKFDMNGDTVFCHPYNMGYRAVVLDVKQLRDSNLIATGYMQPAQAVNGDMFVMKLDTNGNILWQKFYGMSGLQEEGYSILELPNGDLTICGTWNGDLTISNDSTQAFLMKTDSAGNQRWNRLFARHQGSYFWDFKNTIDSGFIMCGTSFLSGGQTNQYSYLCKADSGGNQQWERYYQLFTGFPSELFSIQLDPHGGFVACGAAKDTLPVTRGLLVKYDDAGNFLWEQHYSTGNYLAYLYDMKVLPDSGFIMCGTINHPPGLALQDYLIIRTDSLGCYQNCFTGTGLFNLEPQEEDIVVYPNPATQNIFITANSTEKLQLKIIDVLGKEILFQTFQNGEKEIDIHSWLSGIYFVIVFDGEKCYCKKIIIEKD